MKITLAELKSVVKERIEEAEDYSHLNPKTGQSDMTIEAYHNIVMVRRLVHASMQKSKLLKGESFSRWFGNFTKDMIKALKDISTYDYTREKKFGPITYQDERGLAAMDPKRGKEAEQEVKQLSRGRGTLQQWQEFYDLFHRAISDLQKGLYDQADSDAATKEAHSIVQSYGREGLLAITGLGHRVPSGYKVLDNKDKVIRDTLGDRYRRTKATPTAATKWQKMKSKVGMYEELRSVIAEVLAEGDYHDDEMYDLSAGDLPPTHGTGDVEPLSLVQRIQKSYHDLQDAFAEIEDEVHQGMGQDIITNIETLMDTMEYPEDYRE